MISFSRTVLSSQDNVQLAGYYYVFVYYICTRFNLRMLMRSLKFSHFIVTVSLLWTTVMSYGPVYSKPNSLPFLSRTVVTILTFFPMMYL